MKYPQIHGAGSFQGKAAVKVYECARDKLLPGYILGKRKNCESGFSAIPDIEKANSFRLLRRQPCSCYIRYILKCMPIDLAVRLHPYSSPVWQSS